MIENENKEFKSVVSGQLSPDLWEPITAFSNADGGTIYLGVDPSGIRKGLKNEDLDRIQQEITSLCASAFNYKIYPEIAVAKDSVLEVFIPQLQQHSARFIR